MKAVRHFGIVVRDLQGSLHFYRDLLGLKVVKAMDETGEFIDLLLSLKDARVTTIKMSADNGPTLVEILAFNSHSRDPCGDYEAFRVGPSHIAFTVDDLDAVYHHLLNAEVHFNAPPQLSPDGSAKVTFCRDPDGTLVELVEVLKTAVSSSEFSSQQA